MVWSVLIDFADCEKPATHYSYHRFFIESLRSQPDVDISFTPRESWWLSALAESGVRGSHSLWSTLAEYRQQHKAIVSDRCVRYTFRLDDKWTSRLVIDPSDTRFIRYPGSLDWCDLYLKTNRWAALTYPEKVQPLPNTNGWLTRGRISELKKLRNASRPMDLVYWANIWEPGGETHISNYPETATRKILEHQLRLFETLAETRCKKDLLAIVPVNLRTMASAEVLQRLQSCGVRCQAGWGNIDTRRLWQGLAGAKLVFLRPGNHLCISWRLHELLAMGACVVYDGAPHPVWHEPLTPDEHYVDGGCAITADFSLPDTARYLDMRGRIENLLAEPDRMQAFRTAASNYFDRHLTPSAVGNYLLDRVTASLRRDLRTSDGASAFSQGVQGSLET